MVVPPAAGEGVRGRNSDQHCGQVRSRDSEPSLADEELEWHLDEMTLDQEELVLDLSDGHLVVRDAAGRDVVEILADPLLVFCPRSDRVP